MDNRVILLLMTWYLASVVTPAKSTIVSRSMEKHEIVPDVIDEAPKELLEVTYPSGVNVCLGNELTPTSVKETPTLRWAAEKDTFYTVALVDPDAPSREIPIFREVKHWLVVNVPGGDICKGETLAGYVGPGPPKGTGLHRYVFLVYKQNGKLTHDEVVIPSNTREDRRNFSIRKFAAKYNLCKPIAGNFFQAQWDESVAPRR